MAIKNRFKLTRQKPGANASGLLTRHSGLIVNGVAVAGKLVVGTCYTITSPDMLAALGITPAYDSANKCLVHYHISEFYRGAIPGTELYFMLVPLTITPDTVLEDLTGIYAKKLLLYANGVIRNLAIAYNPDVDGVGFVESLVDGFSAKVRLAIPAGKILRVWADERNMDIAILLEGRKYGDSSAAAVSLRNIIIAGDVQSYEGIAVVIGQDYAFADALVWPSGKFHAAVGTALGTLAGIAMEQDMGEVETLNITDAVLGKFVTSGLSSHKTLLESETQLDNLDDKGYLFPIKYVNISGHRWNGDHACAPVIIDDQGVMNEFKLSYTRTMNECKRSLYDKLVPKVRTTHQVDATTGKLPLAKIKHFEALGDEAMAKLSGVSGAKTTVDPNSDLFTPPQQLDVTFQVVPFGTIGTINGLIALKTSL